MKNITALGNAISLMKRCPGCRAVFSKLLHQCSLIGGGESLGKLTLSEARQIFDGLTIERMRNSLGRDISGLSFLHPPGEVRTKACRVLCTDSYVPFKQIAQSKGIRFSYKKLCELGFKPGKKFFTPLGLVDKNTNSPVDVSWCNMDPLCKNVVTVAEVQETLSRYDQDTYGCDLLQLHLLTGHTRRPTEPLDFSLQDFGR